MFANARVRTTGRWKRTCATAKLRASQRTQISACFFYQLIHYYKQGDVHVILIQFLGFLLWSSEKSALLYEYKMFVFHKHNKGANNGRLFSSSSKSRQAYEKLAQFSKVFLFVFHQASCHEYLRLSTHLNTMATVNFFK